MRKDCFKGKYLQLLLLNFPVGIYQESIVQLQKKYSMYAFLREKICSDSNFEGPDLIRGILTLLEIGKYTDIPILHQKVYVT